VHLFVTDRPPCAGFALIRECLELEAGSWGAGKMRTE
jgi:hypothetical protein